MRKTFGTDGAVELDLALDGLTGIIDTVALDKVDDRLDTERNVLCVSLSAVHLLLSTGRTLPCRAPAHGNAIKCTERHVRMMVADLDLGGMAGPAGGHLDIQVWNALDQANVAIGGIFQELTRTDPVVIIDVLKHLKRARRISAHGAQHGRGLDAVHAPGVGNRNALDVLHDIARAGDLKRLGFAAQCLTGKRRGIGDGDRLGASERADELAVENGTVGGITGGTIGHGWPSIGVEKLKRDSRIRAQRSFLFETNPLFVTTLNSQKGRNIRHVRNDESTMI